MLLGLLPAGIEGQAPKEEALIERINALEAAHSVAVGAADRADSLQIAGERLGIDLRTDTVRVGPFFVVAPHDRAREAESYFRSAWVSYAGAVGSEPTPLHEHYFALQGERPYRHYLSIEGATDVTTSFSGARRRIEHAIAQHIGHRLSSDVPEDLWEWMGGPFYLGTRPEWELEQTFRRLATTPSSATVDCYQAEATRCWDALGLAHRDTWWTSWYDREHRPSLVTRLGNDRDLRDILIATCVEATDDAGCLATLAQLGAGGWIPLPASARMTLVRHALTLGGTGSFQRLMEPLEGSVQDRLARVAGTDAEELISSWRESVMAHRPDTRARVLGDSWIALLWLLFLAALSMRSTKWRLN